MHERPSFGVAFSPILPVGRKKSSKHELSIIVNFERNNGNYHEENLAIAYLDS